MIVSIWRYEVDPANREAFEAGYGPRGAWAELFACAPGYLGTELLCDDDGIYVTLDRWRDLANWTAFKAQFEADYARLDARFDALTRDERPIGIFTLAE